MGERRRSGSLDDGKIWLSDFAMTYGYRLTPAALRELEAELTYSRSNWGAKHAQSYRREIFAALEEIAQFPYGFPEHPLLSGGYRYRRYKGTNILYKINAIENFIEVIGFPSIHRDIAGLPL